MTILRPVLSAALALLAARLPSQMEKRDRDLYERSTFLAAAPAVGTVAPDLVLTDLDGRPVALSSWRGRIVVVVKAGFT